MTDSEQIRNLANQLGRTSGAILALKYEAQFGQVNIEQIIERLNKIYNFIQKPSKEAYNETI